MKVVDEIAQKALKPDRAVSKRCTKITTENSFLEPEQRKQLDKEEWREELAKETEHLEKLRWKNVFSGCLGELGNTLIYQNPDLVIYEDDQVTDGGMLY